MGAPGLVNAGIILFSLVVAFQLVTLPVEFNASGRALRILDGAGILEGNELQGAGKVLRAAALTYVLGTLIYPAAFTSGTAFRQTEKLGRCCLQPLSRRGSYAHTHKNTEFTFSPSGSRIKTRGIVRRKHMAEGYEHSEEKDYLEEMLDNFAKATELGIIAVNTYGEVFLASKDYYECAYCRQVQDTEVGRARCRRTYKKACRQAFLWKEPYFFACHAGLVMWAVPIYADGTEVGAVMCGQVLLWEPDHVFCQDAEKFCLSEKDRREMEQKVKKLRVISADQCQSSANLLQVMMQYLSKTQNAIFMDQKNLMSWRDAMTTRIEERKKTLKNEKFDWSVYLKREKRYLQYVRMADKEKIQNMLEMLFTDIEILCSYDKALVKSALHDFMAVTARAIVEAGADSEVVMNGVKHYRQDMKHVENIEEMMEITYRMLNRWFDSIYLLGTDDHISVMKNVRDYIEENYNRKITLDDICSHVFLSRSYLCTLFRQKTGGTISDYILRVRIEKSIELMGNRELSLKEIMEQCGFESQSYYTKTFRRLIGVNPGQYRNKFL